MSSVLQKISPLSHQYIFGLLMLFSALCFAGGVWLDQSILYLVPFVPLVAGFVIYDYRVLYVLFLLTIPFSIEIFLPNGLGTDLPSEPLMIAITGVAFVLFITRYYKIDYSYLYHPVTILMLLHIIWIAITAVGAYNPIISFKYLLAKIWYVVPFFFMPFVLINNVRDSKKALYLLLVPLMMAVLFVLVRHAGHNFSFKTSNEVVYPIFRNHVNYAAILVMFLPYVFGLRLMDKDKFWKNAFLLLSIVVLVIAVYFSYTRAAQGSLVIAVAAYFMVRWRLTRVAVAAAALLLTIGVTWLIHDNNYLNYAPNYQSTVSHFDFDNLIEATYKLEDISTMERVHRWVAGGRMIAVEPIKGFGPANFYSEYKKFALTEFMTYVSDNPEKSGIHNYYLMVAVEQGIIGLLIFMLLMVFALIKGEDLYHRLQDNNAKILIMSAIICIVVSAAILLINDMLEADKVGPLFFFSLSIIVVYEVLARKGKFISTHGNS